MYFGANFRGKISRSCENAIAEFEFCLIGNSDAICLIIESLTVKAVGEKLNDELEDVGAESLQSKAQQMRATLASFDCSLLFAFLQQAIIWLFIFPECSGIPASTPPASAKTRKSDVSHFLICN
ncbi:hypothetical protein BH10ACI1_BH10ACI1_08000 [soil metagenome]